MKTKTRRPWRMTATYRTGQVKTLPYATKKAAEASADRELTYGAIEVEVWNEEDDR